MQRVEPGSAADAGQKAASFLLSLRSTTAPQHTLLESHPLLLALVSDAVTIRQYYAYLVLMNAVSLVYEEHVLPLTLDYLPGCAQRKASLLLSDDMKKSGYSLTAELSIKGYSVDAEDLSVPFALGFRYVMEGSRLGGRVIYRQIERSLGLVAHAGARYLADDGVNTGVNWKTFLSGFSATVATLGGEHEAIRGAGFAFSSIYDYLLSNRLLYDV